jgi:O-methyltransferase
MKQQIAPINENEKFIKLKLFFKYLFYKYLKKIFNPKYYSYNYDGLSTSHNMSFMQDKNFQVSYLRGKKAINNVTEMPLRAHQAIWAAHHCLDKNGDFVELGTGKGFIMSCVLASIKNWNQLNKTLWLFDSFEPHMIDDSGNQVKNRGVCKYYADNFESVQKNFSEWNNIKMVRGKLPQTLRECLSSNNISNISFLHIDLNFPKIEIECLDLLWSKITTNAIILIDDYSFRGFESSKLAFDSFVSNKKKKILTLASGQGILIK